MTNEELQEIFLSIFTHPRKNPMTNKELQDLLKAYPDDAQVHTADTIYSAIGGSIGPLGVTTDKKADQMTDWDYFNNLDSRQVKHIRI